MTTTKVDDDEAAVVDSAGKDESGDGWLIIRLIGCLLSQLVVTEAIFGSTASSSNDVKPQLLLRSKVVTVAGRRRLIVFLIDAGDTSSSISAIPQLLSRW